MGVPVKKSGKKQGKSSSQARQLSAEDYYMEGEMAYISDNLEAARAAFRRAIDMEKDNPEFLDGYGAFLAECGPRSEAITVLQRACELAPNHGFEKFMYLGQVLDAEDRSTEAEAPMRRGIQILREELAAMSDHPELAGTGGDDAAEENADAREHLREALSSALCSLAELLMCTAAEAADEADGEDGPAALATSPVLVECEQLLGEARQLWPRSPEPLQALCSLRRLQGKEEEALAMLRQSLSMWFKPVLEEPPAGEGPVGTNPSSKDAVDADADPLDAMDSDDVALPSYEFRFECARLLLELDPEAMETAAAVLEGLLEENDSVPDVWLLLAVAYREGGELESAAEAAVEGAKVARTLDLPGDHEVVAALEELEQELGKLVVQETGAEGANGGTHA